SAETPLTAGVSMKNACMRDGMSGIAAWPSILRNAEIIASGFLVSSTEPASARNSRVREMASRMTIDRPHDMATMAMAIRMTMMTAPAFFLPLDRDEAG